MSDNDGIAESPFETGGMGPEPEPEPEPGSADTSLYGLRNSEPKISPHEVGRELDLGVDWYQHLFTGMIKQSSSGGAEAWMHYVVATVLLLDNQYNMLSADEREEVEESTEGKNWDIPDE